MKHVRMILAILASVAVVVTSQVLVASATTAIGGLSFSNTPLLQPVGGDEPAIAIASNGTMAVVSPQLIPVLPFGTHLWTGPFGIAPTFQGIINYPFQQPGKAPIGGVDVDVDLGSTGTLHASSLVAIFDRTLTSFRQLGVAAVTCPNGTSLSVNIANCTAQLIDTTQSDRPWITSDGPRVFIAYHDAANSTLIHVQRSDDDGYTWKTMPSPIVGQGAATGQATASPWAGPIVVDPFTHNVYSIYTGGENGNFKPQIFAPNNIFVSRSRNGGQTWTASLVYHAAPGTGLANVFPSLAVDPTNGKLYAVWSDAHIVSFSMSNDQGATWSPAASDNVAPATTAVFPWVAAYNGAVDVVYYGTTAASKDDPSAVWNVYLAQTTDAGASFAQSLVSNTPNHVGVICTFGGACAPGTRNLLDVFEVAFNSQNGRAAVVYVDDTLIAMPSSIPTIVNFCLPGQTTCPLPEVVLAQQQ